MGKLIFRPWLERRSKTRAEAEESKTDLGLIRIHKKVIASIASLAATEVDGVKRIGGDFRSNLFELLGRKNQSGIEVLIDNSGEIRIEVLLVIKFGFNLPDVASKVQSNIHRSLAQMTNVTIKDINVSVQSIERGGK